MDENYWHPQFCADCPLVPKGVTAQLKGAAEVTDRELRRFRFAQDLPELAAHFAGMIRIVAEVVASERRDVEVGEEARMLVDVDTDADGVRQRIRECQQPTRRLLRSRVCGALGPQKL